MLRDIAAVLIRADVDGSPKKQHYMAVSAGFSQPPSGRKRKNSDVKKDVNGPKEFWSVALLTWQ